MEADFLDNENPRSHAPSRSWAELLFTLHSGIALLDEEWCFAHVSRRFASLVGRADGLIGVPIDLVLPLVRASEDIAHLLDIDQQIIDQSGEPRWIRLRVIPVSGLGDGVHAIVFAQDTTETNRAIVRSRQAALRMTAVEDEEHRRLSRELHDGPIQLLTELLLRLELLDETSTSATLSDMIMEVTADLRDAVEDFAIDGRNATMGSLIERWIEPFLGSQIDWTIDDRSMPPRNRLITQAVFVLVYALVRSTLEIGRQRVQHVTLDDERDGYRVTLSTTASDGVSMTIGRTAAQFMAVKHYIRSLGGTLDTERSDDGVRAFSVWLPAIDEPEVGAQRPVEANALPSEFRRDGWVVGEHTAGLPELTDTSWDTIVRAAPEPIVELGVDFNFTFANRAYELVESTTEAELISGASIATHFSTMELERLAPNLARVRSGEAVQFEWERQNATGDTRYVSVSAAPRFDGDGNVVGAITVLDDRSELHFLQRVHESALVDLQRVIRTARARAIDRLQGPVEMMGVLIEELRRFEDNASEPGPFRTIRRALTSTIPKIRDSVDLLHVPDLSDGDFASALRGSLPSLLENLDLHVSLDPQFVVTAERAVVLFRIAREALINAVIHGQASRVTVDFKRAADGTDDGITLDIVDDGVGIEPNDLKASPGHLGVRAMVERSRSEGGDCLIENDPGGGGGAHVHAWMP